MTDDTHQTPPDTPVGDAELLRRVMDTTSEGIADHRAVRDASGRIVDFEITFMNRALRSHLGLGSENWVGGRVLEHLPEGTDDGRFALLADAVESGETRSLELDIVGQDGQRLHCSFSVVPDGDRAVMSIRDVTEQHRAREEMAESEARYRDLVEHQAELVCRFLPDFTIRFANEAYARYYGHSAQELIGTNILELIPDARRDVARRVVSSLTPEESSITDEGYLVDGEDRTRWQQWTTHGLFDGGRLVEIQSVGIDITDRKLAEHAAQEQAKVLALVNRISRRFIDLSVHDFDRGIDESLADLGLELGVDRAYLVLYRDDGIHLEMTHEWCAEGVAPIGDALSGHSHDALPALRDALHRGDTVRIDSFDDLDDRWEAERRAYGAGGVRSTLIMPVTSAGQLLGSIGFDVLSDQRTWSEQETTLLRSAATAVGQLLGRRAAELEVRLSEQRYRALVSGIPDVLIRVGRDGVVRDWQGELDDVTVDGQSAESGVGRPLAGMCPQLHAVAERAFAHPRPEGEPLVESVQVRSGLQPRSFEARVTVAGDEAIMVVRDVTEQDRLQRSLVHQATHDALTGLANRRLFTDELHKALDHGRITGSFPAVLFIDLDQFKVLNDSQGHDTGDSALQRVAERLDASVRPGDLVSRLGGDEFAVMSHRVAGNRDATAVADRIVAALAEPITVAGEDLVITASVGVVVADADSTASSILRDADAAMYHAKARGRRRVELFTPDIHEAARARHRLEHDLRRALETDELELHYQPIWSITENRWTGVEALARWNHPSRGLLAPGLFLPVAEDAGLMPLIGLWVLDRACRDARRWQTPDAAPFRVWVNLSSDQVVSSSLVAEVTAALAAYELDPSAIGVEVTETAVVGDVSRVCFNLARLRSMGVKVALDDFGTGLSSLTHLDRLPLDVVKLDGAFVAGAGSRDRPYDMVEGIVALVRRLRLDVLAERVEQETEMAALRAIGVDAVQGYFLGRPAPADLVDGLIASPPTGASAQGLRQTPQHLGNR
ncbi:MAG: sensor domain-containing protein [Acidimicrobiales bacterium]